MKINTVGTIPQKRPFGGGKKKKKIPQSPLKVSWLGPPIGLKEWVSLAGHKGALLDNEGGELHAPASSLAELRRQWLFFVFFSLNKRRLLENT